MESDGAGPSHASAVPSPPEESHETSVSSASHPQDSRQQMQQQQQPSGEGAADTAPASLSIATRSHEGGQVEESQGSSTPQEGEHANVAVLLCGGCKEPVASSHEILPERHERAWREHVYCYELDLFENGSEVWAYSATNPSANRFDLIRVLPTVPLPPSEQGAAQVPAHGGHAAPAASASLVSLKGPYSPEHSFFTGYSWCYCSCGNCGHFLGWGFLSHDKAEEANGSAGKRAREEQPPTPHAEEEGASHASSGTDEPTSATRVAPSADQNLPPPDFLGIIVTHCTGDAAFPAKEFVDHVVSADGRRARRRLLDKLRHRLIRIVSQLNNGLVAHRLLAAFDKEMRKTLTTPLMLAEPAASPAEGQERRNASSSRGEGDAARADASEAPHGFEAMLDDARAREAVEGILIPITLRFLLTAADEFLAEEVYLRSQQQRATNEANDESESSSWTTEDSSATSPSQVGEENEREDNQEDSSEDWSDVTSSSLAEGDAEDSDRHEEEEEEDH